VAEVIGCSASDIFSSVASVSGVVELLPGNDDGLALCDKQFSPNRIKNISTSVLKIHGTADPIVPFTGSSLLGFPPIPEDTARWVTRNGCDVNKNISTLNNGPYTNTIWSTCPLSITPIPSPSIQLVQNDGGGHEWPIDQYFDTTEYIVNFFFQQ
jgi:poly(3-hydroxybutyrate) depolymerase